MWFLIFTSLLVLCSGEFESDNCGRNSHDVCSYEPPSNLDDFSDNEEELDAMCPPLIGYVECLGVYERNCKDEFFPIGQYANIRNLLDDVCNKSSKLHWEVSEALPCIKFAKGNVRRTCSHPREPLIELYEEYLNSHREILDEESVEDEILDEETLYEELRKVDCLRFLYEVYCLAEYTLNECGGHARDGIVELIYRSGILYSRCTPDQITNIYDVIAELDIEESQKHTLLDTIFEFIEE